MPLKVTIGSLLSNTDEPPVYRCSDGKTRMKLNGKFHAPAEKRDDYWVPVAGCKMVRFDPNEVVELVDQRSLEVA